MRAIGNVAYAVFGFCVFLMFWTFVLAVPAWIVRDPLLWVLHQVF
jgi:hypothetical protein